MSAIKNFAEKLSNTINRREKEHVDRCRNDLLNRIFEQWNRYPRRPGTSVTIDLSSFISIFDYESAKPEEMKMELKEELPDWRIDFCYIPAHTEKIDDYKNGDGLLHKSTTLTCTIQKLISI